jgi:hypothetical protein
MATVAFAETGDPIGGCVQGFHLHALMDHDDHADHMHQHVGSDKDQNGDGYICVKHVGVDGNIHIHIDNDIPLK